MKNLLVTAAALAGCFAISAQATPIRLDGSEKNLQQIAPSIDVVNGQYALDEAWTTDGFASMAAIVVELAGYANQNRLGIYDVYDPGNRFELFNGAAGKGASRAFSVDTNGLVYSNFAVTTTTFTSQVFGFYLHTPAGLWFSQSNRNADGADHLVAYQTGSQFLFGWEDLAARNWDQDYNDFVMLVGGVKGTAVPEPATLGLLGFGLVGIAAARRRKARNS
jgi:hypothetical protein